MAVGEDSHGVGASADFAVEAFIGVIGPDLGPHPGGEGREREDVCPGLIEVITHGGELVGHPQSTMARRQSDAALGVRPTRRSIGQRSIRPALGLRPRQAPRRV